MVSLRIWKLDGSADIITQPTYGRAFDVAGEGGAVRAIDNLGERFLKIGGEWVGLPNNNKKERTG